MLCALMVITQTYIRFTFPIFFQMLNETRLILILIFQHLYSLKWAKIVVRCEIEMRPAQPHLP